MNYDITFCSKKNCKNLKCERNQKNIPELEYEAMHIWVSDFKKCDYWEVSNDKGTRRSNRNVRRYRK